MNKQQLEDLYIQSLDEKLSEAEENQLSTELHAHPDWARSFAQYKTARETLRIRTQATFGPYFAPKLVHKIQNTGVAIDRQIFGVFKRFQLAAVGVIVALLILNMVFSEQNSWKTALGLENDTTVSSQEQEAPFDFTDTLNDLENDNGTL